MVDREQESLNLHYLLAEDETHRFPWHILIAGVAILAIIILLTWLAQQNQREEVIALHKVADGDSLRSLARLYYDNPREWHRIYLANRQKLLHHQKLVVGEKLRIPLSKKDMEIIRQKFPAFPDTGVQKEKE